MIIIKQKGDLSLTEKFLKKNLKPNFLEILDRYGEIGINALSAATPIDTGLTSYLWGYEIAMANNRITLTWTNSNVVDGIPVVILLQYGHATRNGGYVLGKDFINPAIKPIFNQIADDLWKEVIT